MYGGSFTSVTPGSVVALPDDDVRILPQKNPAKRSKTTRYALVVQGAETAQQPSWEALLVCPIHSDPTATTDFDVFLPAKTVPRLTADSWIVVPSLQPVLKKSVKADLGVIPTDLHIQVLARIIDYLGTASYLSI